eukprot:CAMPEP_0113462726 /NCGR_PEP_ID=MMETSP0014_2-20120614/12259_1 /TAXON_ID=2857 /ORGANISM="Nitzschia sp." /LENGTH=445 /DNA_ID=CAMNT_0000354635 /DNA_START=335 /DNA_END=1672 /DNA_ORIENTATION=- /assembly_acc=CAM_ASM_000159
MSQGKFLAGLLTEMSIDPTNLSIDVVPDNAKSSLVVAITRSRPPSRQTSFCSSQSIQHQQKHHHQIASNDNNNDDTNCPSVSLTNCDGVDKNGSILTGSSSPSWSSSSASASSLSSTPTMTVPPSSSPLQSLPSSVVAATGEDPLVSQVAGKIVGGGGSSSNTFEYHHRDVAAASPIMPISRLTLQNRKERKLRERWGNGESSSISSNSCSSNDGSATRRTSSAGKTLPHMNRHSRKPTMRRSFSDITDRNFHPQTRVLQSSHNNSHNHSHNHNTSTSTNNLPTSPSSMPLSQPRRKLSLTEEELQSMMLPLSSSANSTDMNMDGSLDIADIEHRAPSDEKGGSDDEFSHTAEEGGEQQHDQQQSRRVSKETVTTKMISRFSQSDSCLTSTTGMSMTPRMPVRRRSIEPEDDDFDTSADGNDGSDGSIKLDIINRVIHELTTHDE